MDRKLFSALFLVVSVFFINSCTNKKTEEVNAIDIDLKIQRFETDFFSANPDSLNQVHAQLLAKYGLFYQRFIENITGIGMVNDPAIAYSFKAFLSDKYIREIYVDSKEKYPDDLEDIHNGLTDAFRLAKYHFPEMVVPEIVTFISGFQYSIAVTDSVLGIGLDMYLGSDYENYRRAGLPLYKIGQMRREYIVPDAMKSWLMTEFFADEAQQQKDMLGTMVLYGKIMYLLDEVLPEVSDTLKIGFTAMQMEWCKKNEFNIWAHLVDKEILFSTDPMATNKFFNDAPFTSGLPKESPPRVGVWVGWQIIKSYMDKNPGISLPALMKQLNAQEILSNSKYKPGK